MRHDQPFGMILGTGSSVPKKILSNDDLTRLVQTSDEWIYERTGIRERRMASDKESTSTFAIEAARKACQSANIQPQDIDLIIVATVTPDRLLPSTSCLVQAALDAKKAAALDVVAGCTGFVYGLATAQSFLRNNLARKILLIGAETLTRFVDYTDRRTCVLFGDGAGAVVLAKNPDQNSNSGLLSFQLKADGTGADLIEVPAGGSRFPSSHSTVEEKMHFLKMKGADVYRFAVSSIVDLITETLDYHELDPMDVDIVICHQVNERIIDAAAKRLPIPKERFYSNVERYGNTSAASIPIALDEALREGKCKKGSLALLVGFGSGLTQGIAVVRL